MNFAATTFEEVRASRTPTYDFRLSLTGKTKPAEAVIGVEAEIDVTHNVFFGENIRRVYKTLFK